MKYLFILLFSMFYFFSPGQQRAPKNNTETIRINDQDQVVEARPEFIKKKLKVIVDSSALKAWNEKSKDELKESIRKNIHASLETLTGEDASIRKFYEWAWGSADLVEQLIKGLQAVKDSLENTDYKAGLPASSNLYQLDSTVSYLLNAKRMFYKTTLKANDDYYRLDIEKEYPVNTFLIDYYNTIISDKSNKPFTKLTFKKRNEMLANAKTVYDSINTLLVSAKAYIKGNDNIPISMLNRMYNANEQFKNYAATDQLSALLKAPFTKQWIWTNSGIIRLNPLDFTTANLMQAFPEYDVFKASHFNEYIDSLINRYIRGDSTGHLDKFKELLVNKDKGQQVFNNSAKHNELLLANDSVLNSILVNKFTANSIKTPYRNNNNRYLQYAADTEIKDPKASPLAPLTTDDRVYVTAYNVKQGDQTKLVKVKSEKIADRSPFQVGLDTGLAQVANAVVLLTPQIGLLNSLSQLNNLFNKVSRAREVPLPTSDQISKSTLFQFYSGITSEYRGFMGNMFMHRYEKISKPEIFWSHIKEILKLSYDTSTSIHKFNSIKVLSFDTTLFNSIKFKYKKSVSTAIGKDTLHILEIQIIQEYFTALLNKQLAPALIDTLRVDSLYLAYMMETVNKSTLPPPPLKAKENKPGPLLRTVIASTDYEDDRVKDEYKVMNYSGKDSIEIGRFTYKTGKRYFSR